ncbi:putative FYVE and coiled-coil domain-containing protein 1 isoform X2 [Apostichopus japonicus]|uniref:Putative FYVE and coiled-coil domain-containing protein 1 isoform X2 n=1 Tax=Stichopus japonicus TaxID=307972 RepID=A0A2G8LJT3_STIJA|nr:putative FYVE and coiled-coil domain-containing protein 1 isoform X2 [Apostichopus japonicus]
MKDHRIIQGNCCDHVTERDSEIGVRESVRHLGEGQGTIVGERRNHRIAGCGSGLRPRDIGRLLPKDRETEGTIGGETRGDRTAAGEIEKFARRMSELEDGHGERGVCDRIPTELRGHAISRKTGGNFGKKHIIISEFEELTSELSHWKERCEELEENLATKRRISRISKPGKRLLKRKKNKISNQLEQRAKNVIELEDMVKSTQKYDASQIDQLRAKLEQKEKDNEELMKQIVKFGKEKDVMWQRLQKVENHRKLKAMERWIEDKDVKQCMECECQFSLTVRKHHCRMCGGVFCSKCTECSILTSQSKKKVRVCEKCFVLHNHSLESEGLDTSAIINDSVEEEHLPTFNDSRLSISSSSSLTDPPTTSASAVGSDADQNAGREDSSQDNEEAERQETAGEEGATDQGGHENQGEAAEVKNETEAADGSSSGRDGDFDIITDEDVTEIRQEEDEEEKKEEEEALASETKPEYSQFDSVTSDEIQSAENQQKEVYLVAGTSHMIPVVMDAEGVLLCWEFTSSPKSIAFKVSYAESVGDELLEEIVPLQRFNSHQQSASGELLTYKKGVYVLQFDNTFSTGPEMSIAVSFVYCAVGIDRSCMY